MLEQPKLNLKLLRKVRDRIAEIPESYDQTKWIMDSAEAPCGAAACVAGETIICDAPTVKQGINTLRSLAGRSGAISDRASALLGISEEEADVMFDYSYVNHTVEWPSPFKRRFAAAATPQAQAVVAVAYLDECLKRKAVTW